MKPQDALQEAWEFEQKCLAVIKAENEKWKVSDEEIGELKHYEEAFDRDFSGMLTLVYLNELVEADLIEDSGVEISELPAVSHLGIGNRLLKSQ